MANPSIRRQPTGLHQKIYSPIRFHQAASQSIKLALTFCFTAITRQNNGRISSNGTAGSHTYPRQVFGIAANNGLRIVVNWAIKPLRIFYSWTRNINGWLPNWHSPRELSSHIKGTGDFDVINPELKHNLFPLSSVSRSSTLWKTDTIDSSKPIDKSNCDDTKDTKNDIDVKTPVVADGATTNLLPQNWPTITADFWPKKNGGIDDLIRRHGPTKTWYASSAKPSPPASTLPIPSFVLRRQGAPTMSKAAVTAKTAPGIDSNISSISPSPTTASSNSPTTNSSRSPSITSSATLISTPLSSPGPETPKWRSPTVVRRKWEAAESEMRQEPTEISWTTYNQLKESEGEMRQRRMGIGWTKHRRIKAIERVTWRGS